MKNRGLSVKAILLLVVIAVAISSCSKKTCPAYSQVNQTETSNRA